jgi:hypothetical protein
MADKRRFVHQEIRIIEKLIEDLSEFTSDEDIASIATRVLGKKIERGHVGKIRTNRLEIHKEEGPIKKTHKAKGFLDRYDHRSIRDFLKNHRKRK